VDTPGRSKATTTTQLPIMTTQSESRRKRPRSTTIVGRFGRRKATTTGRMRTSTKRLGFVLILPPSALLFINKLLGFRRTKWTRLLLVREWIYDFASIQRMQTCTDAKAT